MVKKFKERWWFSEGGGAAERGKEAAIFKER